MSGNHWHTYQQAEQQQQRHPGAVNVLRSAFYAHSIAVYIFIIAVTSCIQVVTPLANCPSSCQCDDNKLVVNCGEGHLDVLPITLNPSIQRLVIRNNKIKTIDSSMQFYGELNYLDLSNNHLFNIPPRTFMFQAKLQELHLNHNKISAITNHTFIGLSALIVLNLRGNLFDELSGRTFYALNKLEELNLGQNRIARIDADTFAGLHSLRALHLDDNELITVPSDALPPLQALAELYLGINAIVTVQSGAFRSLTNLNKLDLKGAGFANLSTGAFAGLETLVRSVDLSDNQLQHIPTEELSVLVRLEELSLGQNQFEVVPVAALAGLVNLRRLDITGSLKLHQVLSGAFSINTNLETITLASNKELDDIQEGAFSGLPHLKQIILRDNAIAMVSEQLAPWKKLDSFDLSDNPIRCDCRMMWLRDMLQTKNTSQTSAQNNVICASPALIADEPLRNISPEQMGCSNSDPRQQAMFGILLVGAAAMITAIALFLCRCRRKIRDMLGGNWRTTNIGHKEREYQKTFSDEDYMHAVARHSAHPVHPAHPCNLNVHHHTTTVSAYPHPHHQYAQSGIKPIPVTEL